MHVFLALLSRLDSYELALKIIAPISSWETDSSTNETNVFRVPGEIMSNEQGRDTEREAL
jgi:hypothetical protein